MARWPMSPCHGGQPSELHAAIGPDGAPRRLRRGRTNRKNGGDGKVHAAALCEIFMTVADDLVS